MGVSGLLPLLKSIHKHTSLKNYAGQTLGVDAFGWLHRGAVACAYQLALDKPTTQYVAFVVNRVRMLLDFGIIPYMVFDGDSVPSKASTNARRKRDREAAKKLGLALNNAGKKDQAQQEWAKAVTVTPQMTFEVIEAMRRMNVQILVAPYEADAQLTYLEKEGIIDGILSEDSDLLVFGAKKLITKLDQHGSCVEINRADFMINKEISFAGWSDSMFRRMAILSGCDYLPSINGVGLKTAHGFVKKHKEVSKVVRMMALNGKYVIPQDYLANFADAERSFLYHRVFCPKSRELVLLNTLPPDLKEEDMPYLGLYVEPELAIGVACGELNPKTKEPFLPSSKARHFTAREPQLQETRKQSMRGTNDLKPRRSLDNFFKRQRIPLAELDPNSLTPSPSQQRLLERSRNASWEPRLVGLEPHSAPPLRRAVTDLARSQAAPYSAQTNRESFLTKAAALSTYTPVKRQRLCSESDEVSPSKEIKQSKFFSPNVIERSPLTSKKGRDRRMKKTAFNVFSDDSIEAIMLGLEKQSDHGSTQVIDYPVLATLPSAESTTPNETEVVPQSSPIKTQAAVIDLQSSQGNAEMNAILLKYHELSQPVKKTHLNKADDPDAFDDLLCRYVSEQNEAVRARARQRTFSSQSPAEQSAALASLPPAAAPREVEPARTRERDIERDSDVIASPQLLSSAESQSFARTFACQSTQLQSRALRSIGKASSISNIVHTVEVAEPKGSEDALIPSSPSRGSDAEGRPSRGIDLKRFQYVGS